MRIYVEFLNTYVVIMEIYSDQVHGHMSPNSVTLVACLKKPPQLQEEVTDYLFSFFEERSLYKKAELIALKMLTNDSWQFQEKNKVLFEQ